MEEAYKSEGRMDVCPSLGKSPMVDGVIACPCLCPKDVRWGPSCPYGDVRPCHLADGSHDTLVCRNDSLRLVHSHIAVQTSCRRVQSARTSEFRRMAGAGFNLNGNFTFGSNLVADVGDDEGM